LKKKNTKEDARFYGEHYPAFWTPGKMPGNTRPRKKLKRFARNYLTLPLYLHKLLFTLKFFTMNTKNLIFISTKDMTREQWLDFREPMTHVRKHIQKFMNLPTGRSQKTFEELKNFFAGDAWQSFDFPCVGSSEAASVIGLNPYQSVIELYFEKVGIKPTYREDNIKHVLGQGT
jgi:hypothetical protein